MCERFGELEINQLTERMRDIGHTPADVLSAAIADADADIDGYLTDGGYTLPIASTPELLRKHACILTRFYLYKTQRPNEVKEDYDRSIGWLKRIAERKSTLPGIDLPATGGTKSTPAAPTRTMTYDSDLWETYTQ